MKQYQASIYQLQDALKTAQENGHIEVIMGITVAIKALSIAIENGYDVKIQELS